MSGVPTSETKQGASEDQTPSKESVRIAVTICMSNGVFVKRKNLSYESLLKFVASESIPDNGGFREKNRYIEFLIQQKEERDRTIAEKDAFIKNLQDTLDMLKSMHESDSKKIDELKTAHEEDARKMNKLISSINDLTAQLKLKNKSVK